MEKNKIPYYEDMTRISNSNIGWFLKKGPAYLRNMLDGKEEGLSLPQLAKGTMIHEYLLQPEEFQKDYVVWDAPQPKSSQETKFCEELAMSTEIEPDKAVLSAYKAAYRTTGQSESKMLSEGLKKASTLNSYIQSIKENDKRIKISPYTMKKLMELSEVCNKHKKAKELLADDRTSDILTHHEFHINWEVCGVKCKSLLDCVKFDVIHKTIILMDIKTTSHLYSFEDSMREFDYLRQLCFYTLALKWYIETELYDNPEDWTFKWYIVGISNDWSNQVRVFEFTSDQVYSRVDTIYKALQEIKWHQETNNWDYYSSYYESDGAEKLNL